MPTTTTEPGDLDTMPSEYGPPKRRSADHKVETIVNSPWMRLSLYVLNLIVVIALGLFSWTGTTVLAKLTEIDSKINAFQVERATSELRIKGVESYRTEAESRDRQQEAKIGRLEFEVERLTGRPLPTVR